MESWAGQGGEGMDLLACIEPVADVRDIGDVFKIKNDDVCAVAVVGTALDSPQERRGLVVDEMDSNEQFRRLMAHSA